MILSRGGFVLRNEKNKSGCGCLIPTILIVSAVLIFTFASNKSNSSSSGSTKPTDADRSWSVSSSSETFFPKAVPTEPETSAQSNTSASDDFVLGDARYIKNTAKHSYDALSNTTQRDFYKIFEASFNSVTTETYDSKYQTKMFDTIFLDPWLYVSDRSRQSAVSIITVFVQRCIAHEERSEFRHRKILFFCPLRT